MDDSYPRDVPAPAIPVARQVSAMVLDPRVTSQSRPINPLYLLQQQGTTERYRNYTRASLGVHIGGVADVVR